jgi:hypothetical protein
MRRITRVFGLGLLGAVLVAGPVWAGQPQRELVQIDDEFVDEFLSDACGVEVNAHVTGHIITRLFRDADGNLVRELTNYANSILWWSENGEIHAKDVGVDRVTLFEDGSVLLIIIGSVQSFSIPGQGRVYSDVGRTMVEVDAAGNVTVTPLGGQHDTDQIEAICGVLGD